MTLWLREMGAEVTGLAPGPPTDPSLYDLAGLAGDVPQHAIDIRDADGVVAAVRESRPEVVIHMAAQPFVRRSFIEPRETYEVNVMGTINLFEAVRTAGDDVGVILNVTSDSRRPARDAHARTRPRSGRFVRGRKANGPRVMRSGRGGAGLGVTGLPHCIPVS